MGSATSAERFAAAKGMLDYGFANFALYTPVVQEGAAVAVTLGNAPSVNAMPAEDVPLLVEKGQVSSIVTEIKLEPQITAPVAAGQALGTLTIKSGDGVLKEIPLVAESDVNRLTWGNLTVKILRQVAMAKQ